MTRLYPVTPTLCGELNRIPFAKLTTNIVATVGADFGFRLQSKGISLVARKRRCHHDPMRQSRESSMAAGLDLSLAGYAGEVQS